MVDELWRNWHVFNFEIIPCICTIAGDVALEFGGATAAFCRLIDNNHDAIELGKNEVGV